MAESKIVYRFEMNAYFMIGVCVCVSLIVLALSLFFIPAVQLTWVSDFSDSLLKWVSNSLLKWVSDFSNSLLKWVSDFSVILLTWFSDSFLPHFTEFTSSTIITLANPLCLLLYVVANFLIACWTSWFEVKASAQSAWIPIERAAVAIFQLFSNPQTLIQYAFFAVFINIFPEVIYQVSQGLMKSNKL